MERGHACRLRWRRSRRSTSMAPALPLQPGGHVSPRQCASVRRAPIRSAGVSGVRRRHRRATACWEAVRRTSCARSAALGGRALAAGDRLPLGAATHRLRRLRAIDRAAPFASAGGARLRVIPGPQDESFPSEAFDRLQRDAVHRHAAIGSDGVPSEWRTDSAHRRWRDDLRRDVHRRAAGAAVGRADPADGRSADDRRVSADRHRDHRRSAPGRAARSRRLDRVPGLLPA